MAKLPRVTAKIFASNAAPNDIGQYGSALTGTKVNTSDIATIQALPAYEEGWRGAVISNRNYPTLQEMNGLQKTLSQQIAYTLETGIPEWDANTTYYAKTSFCQVDGVIYQSLTDDNKGNNPTEDTNNWVQWGNDSNKANTSLDNLTPEGEKHFLNYSQVTNCITSIPQRIKYDLTGEVLTILAGTVFPVPYGTEAPALNIGDYLLGDLNNNNFKIVDIQYEPDKDGNYKLFYWCEVQRNIIQAVSTNWASGLHIVAINLTHNTVRARLSSYSGTVQPSGNAIIWYHTDSNIINDTSELNIYCSFPIFLMTVDNTIPAITEIDQVFNGMGYLGSTFWVDKGIEGLASYGKNNDGTLISEKITTKLLLYTISNNGENNETYYALYSPNLNNFLLANRRDAYFETRAFPPISNKYTFWLDTSENYLYHSYVGGAWVYNKLKAFRCFVFTRSQGKITKLEPIRPFQAADAQDIDGQWITYTKTLFQGTPAQDYKATYDLSGYLPSDGHIYEVMVDAIIRTGAAANNCFGLYVQSSVITNGTPVCRAVTRTAANVVAAGSTIFPVGPDHTITFLAGNETNAKGYTDGTTITLNGYRKVR